MVLRFDLRNTTMVMGQDVNADCVTVLKIIVLAHLNEVCVVCSKWLQIQMIDCRVLTS